MDLLLNVLARTSPVTGFRIANLRGGEEVVNRANEWTFCPVYCPAGHDLGVEAAATYDLMGADGRWRLAPAFDMTWAYGGQWAMTHQMTARGKDDDFTRDDLLAVGRMFDVPRDGADMLVEVEAALGLWVPEAQEAGLGPEWITRVQSLFRHFA